MDTIGQADPLSPRPVPSLSDIKELVLLAGFALPAWFLPERAWGAIVRVLGTLLIAVRPTRMRAGRHAISCGLAALHVDRPAKRIQRDLMGAVFERYFQVLREYAPWGWHPSITLEGLDNVRDALAIGRGVILYVYPTVFYALISKKGLAQAGLPIVHLSREGHGFSSTAFGKRYINPFLTHAENRYIRQRLVVEEGAARSLRPLFKALAGNSAVTITANAEGRVHVVPFAGGTLRLARGSASIALASAAALVPMMVFREAPGRYRAVFDRPLDCKVATGDKDADERRILEDFAARLAPFVARHPEQFAEWHSARRFRPCFDSV